MKAASCGRIRYSGEIPHLFDTLLYGPLQRGALSGAPIRPSPAVRQRSRLRRLPARPASGAARPGANGSDRMIALAGSHPGDRRPRPGAAASRDDSDPQGSPTGTSRPLSAAALPGAAPALGKDSCRPAADDARLSPRPLPRRRGDGPRPVPGADRRPLARTGRSATTRSSSSACSPWPGSPSPRRAGTPGRDSR